MKRRSFINYSGLGVAGILINPLDKLILNAPGAFTPLRGNVGYFTERGGTIGWLINSEGIAVVDTQFPEQAQNLIDEIKKKSTNKIDCLINTHHHGDHSGGNIAFKGIAKDVIAHKNSKENQMRVAKERAQEETQLYPNLTFDEMWKTKVGDETISCTYHGRGHTNGDIVTHFENANIVHMGDLVFNRRFPYIDTGAGSLISNWINILDVVNGKFDDETIFIFGHAAEGYEITGTKEDIKAFKNYLEKLLEFGQQSIKAGKSLDEIMENTKAIPGAPDWKGNGIGRSLSAVYFELGE